MANVLVIVKGGMVVGVLADSYNVNVHILDQDVESLTDMAVAVGVNLYDEYVRDLGHKGFHIGDEVVVCDDWQGTIVGFKKEHSTDEYKIYAMVKDQDGNVLDINLDDLDWDYKSN